MATGRSDSAAVGSAAQRLRTAIRAGTHHGLTTGLAPGMVQANLVVLPADWAEEFRQYCARNPKPCPLLAMTAPGDPTLPALGDGIDIRTDLPRYNVFRDGELVEELPISVNSGTTILSASRLAVPIPSRRHFSTPGCHCATTIRRSRSRSI